MLVLSRRINECVVIGGNVEVVISRIEGDLVKLGINAPREISIVRKEVLTDVARSNRVAVLASAKPFALPKLGAIAIKPPVAPSPGLNPPSDN